MRIFQNSSISKKLTMIIMFTCFVSLSLSALFLTVHKVICYRQNLVEKIEVLAKVTGHSLIFPLLFGNSTDAGETLKNLSGEQQILSACVYEPNGNLFAAYDRGDSAPEGSNSKSSPSSCPASIPEQQKGSHDLFSGNRLEISRSLMS